MFVSRGSKWNLLDNKLLGFLGEQSSSLRNIWCRNSRRQQEDNMSKFIFQGSEKAIEYCHEIAIVMQSEFNINEDEAISRINSKWSDFVLGDEDMIFHESPEFWAYDIYYGANSKWWLCNKEELHKRAPAAYRLINPAEQ
jgi:hypothetical protein